ncbi:MAG: fimbrillin family protein [Bacteroides sp.]|nr:fimbrillin family protein [Bacteroides sp.]
MKKNSWLLGVAVAALTSCTQSEVLDVPEGRTIGFEPFVGKSTRAAQMIQQAQRSGETVAPDNLYQFWVFGRNNGDVEFDATDEKAKVYYNSALGGFTYDDVRAWQLGHEYSFAAYSNGNKPLVTNAQENITASTVVTNTSTLGVEHAEIKDNQGNVTGSTLTFKGYEVGDDDLLAAIVRPKTMPTDVQSATQVPFNFQHMLSLIHIQLENNTENLYLQISDIEFEGIIKDDCVYKIEENVGTGNFDKSILWNNMDTDSNNDGDAATGDYKFIGTGVNADNATAGAINGAMYLKPGDVIHLRYFVIPQSNQDMRDIDLYVYSYTYDDEAEIKYNPSTTDNVSEHKISLAVSETGHQIWQPGYQYHYSGSLSGQAHWIQFIVNSVDTWTTDHEYTSSGSVITN